MEVEEYEYGWRARQYNRFETAIESVRREVKEKEDCNLTTGRCVSLGDGPGPPPPAPHVQQT